MARHLFGIISDTHGHLHPRAFDLFDGAVAIVHAGDVVRLDILDELEAIAPTFAVLGNCDMSSPRLPVSRRVDLPFGVLGVTHGHLVAGGFPTPRGVLQSLQSIHPRVAVFGHTHKAYQGVIDGVLVLNPGSAGKPRFRDVPSLALLHWDDAADTLEAEIVTLDWSGYGGGR